MEIRVYCDDPVELATGIYLLLADVLKKRGYKVDSGKPDLSKQVVFEARIGIRELIETEIEEMSEKVIIGLKEVGLLHIEDEKKCTISTELSNINKPDGYVVITLAFPKHLEREALEDDEFYRQDSSTILENELVVGDLIIASMESGYGHKDVVGYVADQNGTKVIRGVIRTTGHNYAASCKVEDLTDIHLIISSEKRRVKEKVKECPDV